MGTIYFTEPLLQQVNKSLERLKTIVKVTEELSPQNQFMIQGLESIQQNFLEYEICKNTLRLFAGRLNENLVNIPESDSIEFLSLFCYRLNKEILFLEPQNLVYRGVNFELIEGIEHLLPNKDAYEWSRTGLPLKITEEKLKAFLENPDVRTFSENAPLINQHVLTLKELELQVEALSETLTKQRTAFNFVALDKGFENIRNTKNVELKHQNWASWGLMFFILLVPCLMANYYANSHNLTKYITLAIPALSVELFLLYFYRVNLQHLRSSKAQLVQLELRQALCQFIQSYAEYAKGIKANDKDALDKFENLIFSGLAINENQVPTSFDGLDSILNAIKSIKG